MSKSLGAPWSSDGPALSAKPHLHRTPACDSSPCDLRLVASLAPPPPLAPLPFRRSGPRCRRHRPSLPRWVYCEATARLLRGYYEAITRLYYEATTRLIQGYYKDQP